MGASYAISADGYTQAAGYALADCSQHADGSRHDDGHPDYCHCQAHGWTDAAPDRDGYGDR